MNANAETTERNLCVNVTTTDTTLNFDVEANALCERSHHLCHHHRYR